MDTAHRRKLLVIRASPREARKRRDLLQLLRQALQVRGGGLQNLFDIASGFHRKPKKVGLLQEAELNTLRIATFLFNIDTITKVGNFTLSSTCLLDSNHYDKMP